MRNYDLYLIEEEVAYHYFGREQILYHFFVEATHPIPHLKETIERQLLYITKSIPFYVFDYQVKQIDALRKGYKMQKSRQEIILFSKTSKAVLRNNGRKLTLIAEGNYEAETLMFEHLRKLEASFLAINFEGKSIGWLSPLKQAHYI
ncbi:sporulation inhibitor of replication protein SirA [Alkalihalobacillus sp. AL-G]|uniref:sporulation inhibitor of replication protein SirA n=1 Tax=Alkalihalobacillus sp. AL-G TaxID=2926399 RepID=UPI00272C1DE2|nr:sporulation inhibitor of replication protein SirA [Alkalihalobacillus sp. AL-G]WLD95254.1 sporulation inhibitor of replication protein SirA [Alkalihalobacillus sp. AL-G]